MTSGESPVTSEERLAVELEALLMQAHDNGVDVEGGWACRNDRGYPDWDVVVTEVTEKAGPE